MEPYGQNQVKQICMACINFFFYELCSAKSWPDHVTMSPCLISIFQGFHQLLPHHQSCGQPSNICVSCTWKLPTGGLLRGGEEGAATGQWKLLNHHRCNRRCCMFLGHGLDEAMNLYIEASDRFRQFDWCQLQPQSSVILWSTSSMIPGQCMYIMILYAYVHKIYIILYI